MADIRDLRLQLIAKRLSDIQGLLYYIDDARPEELEQRRVHAQASIREIANDINNKLQDIRLQIDARR